MRKVFFFCLAGALLVSVSAMAQNKVVVIPLNSSKFVPGGVYTVTSAGQVWMDRNLGALRVATKSDDPDAYGTLYQWGRLGDGHEYRSSSTISIQSNSNVPGHGSFITGFFDWRNPPSVDLWQGESGINNPCPAGFRLPTAMELDTERKSWSTNDAAGAFASPLKFVVAGYRDPFNESIIQAGSRGGYWSSSVDLSSGIGLEFGSDSGVVGPYLRAHGFSVRCIKD